MTVPVAPAYGTDDRAYHEARVLLLVDAACQAPRSKGVLEGLTKLAKMDFLVRYPGLIEQVIDAAEVRQPRQSGAHVESSTDVDDPMIRYRYGPWDERYYQVIGRLVGRGLVNCTKGRRGAITFRTTDTGRSVAHDLARREEWSVVAQACVAVADLTAAMTGNRLKVLIYERLPDLMNRRHREVIA